MIENTGIKQLNIAKSIIIMVHKNNHLWWVSMQKTDIC